MSNNLTKQPTVAPTVQTIALAQASAPKQVHDRDCNLYGMLIENLDVVKVYICFFDKDSAPVAGVDTPVVSFPVEAESSFGRDPQSFSLAHFAKGCWVSAALAPDGVGDVTTEPVIRTWTKD